MSFTSILFVESTERERDYNLSMNAPECFVDLNLDRVVSAITQGRDEYDINAFFFSPLKNVEDISYRQEVIQDVAKKEVYATLIAYSTHMRTIREILSKKENMFYHFQKRRWELDCIILYTNAISELCARLNEFPVESRGMLNFKSYINEYNHGEIFQKLHANACLVKNRLEEIKYSTKINGNTIIVERYCQEIDYSDKIINLFSKFKQRDVRVELDFKSNDSGINHVEAQILDCVAKLFHSEFDVLNTFIANHPDYVDSTLTKFEREIQFYLAYIEYIQKFQKELPFCIPTVTREKKGISVSKAFDLALADAVIESNRKVICNEFYLQDNERILVVSGPNQGGKTTFARMVGQLHYLALLGVFVPAEEAKLYLTDRIFTHFEKSENIHNLRGKLYDDLVRIKVILDSATSRSLIIMNEIFTSTSTQDAVYLGTRIMEKILALDALCVCVTFIDELTHLNCSIVSMMSTVGSNDCALRTYQVIRKPADGVAYSTTLVEKYSLTYDKIKERLGR
ncbi:MutS-related protein [Hafnia psychrotolerans]|uniref:DNA mismatch repair proteins mutS family domain-containing protein n=1 Tax=Hafnia psychrotolerans TaxID=1477018 RepID=A0ABQ1GJP7_9GAMM|nr:DNA mismatch repair protein MutS [Hafnia psychrotolerans]GGA44764.1 hypothetical protein GCM10011328_19860 [Hafnia psychrotolerans]